MKREIIQLNLNDIKLNEKNPRTINKRQLDKLVKSVQEFPEMTELRPIVVDENNTILGGNMRYRAMQKLGMSTAEVVRVTGLTDEQKREFIIKDNVAFGDWDWDALANEWDMGQLDEWGLDIPESEVVGQEVTEVKEDEAPEVKDGESKAKRGDIYQLGRHRLMCGDSTKKEDVDKLMDGVKADMVFTDPPYGMSLDTDYDGMFANDKSHRKTGKRFNEVIGDNDDFSDDLINTIFNNFDYCQEIFIWGADYFSELIPNRKNGSWLVWDKRCDEKMDEVVGNTFELCWSKNKHKRLVARILWSGYHGMVGADSGKRLHPTQKPVKLIEWFFQHWGKKNDTIVDLFGGSGSTLIACEQLNRKCYMMELDPHYVDVIIERWENFTGQKAKLLKGV